MALKNRYYAPFFLISKLPQAPANQPFRAASLLPKTGLRALVRKKSIKGKMIQHE
jgi:hypothetical protein